MLSNAYFRAKFGFDTAENEPAKNLQIFANLISNPEKREKGEIANPGLAAGAPVLGRGRRQRRGRRAPHLPQRARGWGRRVCRGVLF